MKATIAATLVLALTSRVFVLSVVTPAVLLRFTVLLFCILTLSRLSMRRALTALRMHGRNLRHLIIVGTNSRAIDFASAILSRPDLGYHLIGFVDDLWFGPKPEEVPCLQLVSDLAGFRSYLRDHIVDEVIVALPMKSFYDEEDVLIRTCHEHGVVVRILTTFFEPSTVMGLVDELGTVPVVTLSSVPVDTRLLLVKRTVDVLVSGFLLILLSPLMLTVFLLVTLDSAGAAIFTQERIGLNKRRFRIYKFRTMVADAEKLQLQLEARNEAQGPVFKIKKDPRITRLGRILRKTSIDELPQLFNVLNGDMSLVGPRPLPVRDYTGFSHDWQRRRFSVRPGITCLWQVSGRSSITFDQWMVLDMEYIDRWSLWLDLQILVRTIPAVVRGSGAA
jgi:exopolysaccharide biosynthesis polyprenyl glycosylphosphotransferase